MNAMLAQFESPFKSTRLSELSSTFTFKPEVPGVTIDVLTLPNPPELIVPAHPAERHASRQIRLRITLLLVVQGHPGCHSPAGKKTHPYYDLPTKGELSD